MRSASLGVEFLEGGLELRVVYKQRRDRMLQATPQGARLISDTDAVMYLLESEGAAAVAGTAYGPSPYSRQSIATSIEKLEEGARRIARAVAALDWKMPS